MLINGKPAKEFAHEGKIFIEGRKGTRFSIRMRNNSYSRKLFVPTIDGLSVMNGEEGSFDSSGYIVQGNSSVTIDGWRTSDKEVAEFYFSSPENSYRRKMNKGNNLGIIGVAVFSEVFHYPAFTTVSSTGSGTYTFPNSATFLSTATGNGITYRAENMDNVSVRAMYSNSKNLGSTHTQALGTGWGDIKRSEVTSVNFERTVSPDAIFEIQYNTREQLEEMGIDMQKAPLYVAPQAFPGQYCKPPKNTSSCANGRCRSSDCATCSPTA